MSDVEVIDMAVSFMRSLRIDDYEVGPPDQRDFS